MKWYNIRLLCCYVIQNIQDVPTTKLWMPLGIYETCSIRRRATRVHSRITIRLCWCALVHTLYPKFVCINYQVLI